MSLVDVSVQLRSSRNSKHAPAESSSCIPSTRFNTPHGSHELVKAHTLAEVEVAVATGGAHSAARALPVGAAARAAMAGMANGDGDGDDMEKLQVL